MAMFASKKPFDGVFATHRVPGDLVPDPSYDRLGTGVNAAMLQSTQQPVKGPGFLDHGGMGKAMLGGLFDSIIQQTGGGTPNRDAATREQQMRFAAAQDARKRNADFADFTKQWDYQAAHPKPVNNDTTADYAFWQSKLSPEEFEAWKANKINPPHFTQLPNGQLGMVGGYTPPAKSAPAPGTVTGGYRFKGGDPASQSNWEPVGGPTPHASGTFS